MVSVDRMKLAETARGSDRAKAHGSITLRMPSVWLGSIGVFRAGTLYPSGSIA